MKKVIQVVFLFIIMIGLSACGEKKCEATKDEHNFKEEYEQLNGKINDSGKKMLKITIPENSTIKYVNEEEVITFLKEGTGVVYFGFPECPWCRIALPVFFDVAKNYSPCEILYFDARSIRDEKELKNDNVITKKEGTKGYQEILTLLGEYANLYEGLNDESMKRLYMPTMVFIRDGNVIGTHMGTVESQEDPYKKLTREEEKELKGSYEALFEKVKANMCTKDAC